MGSGWHEWPLMIFTVFGQCVAGGFIVLALALLKGDLRAEAQQRVIIAQHDAFENVEFTIADSGTAVSRQFLTAD